LLVKVELADTAFRHGFQEEDFFEVLASNYIKLRSQRGIADVFELLGQNLAGDYLHIIYRVLSKEKALRVFHMKRMTESQKRRFKQIAKK
jgi:hypothetical protein